MVTLVDGTPVYGIPSKSSEARFLTLDDAFFISGTDDTDVNLLRRFGNEIHRPLPFLAIPWSSVLYEEQLSTDSPALAAIIQFEQSNPPTATPEATVGGGATSAVFLRNGDVFFGRAELDGEALTLAGSHFLRFKDEALAEAGEITSLDQVELVAQQQSPSGTTGEMTIPLSSILYVQTLASDSPVTEATTQE